MIYYIKNEAKGAFIYPNKRRSGKTALGVIKKICTKHLTSLSGYLQSFNMLFNNYNKKPIVLSSKCAFFYTKGLRDYESIWINYMAIKEIVFLEKEITFIFDEVYSITVPMSTHSYQRLAHLIFKVLNYKQSLE